MYEAINPFQNLMTEEAAYTLGYTYADGCIASNNVIIYSSIDLELIENMKHIYQYNGPIKVSNRKSGFGSTTTSYRMEVCRKSLCDFLKELDIKNPSFFPDFYIGTPYMRHYIRGVFEGDGSVSICESQYKDKTYKKGTWSIILHKSVLNQFTNELKHLGRVSVVDSKTEFMKYIKNSSNVGIMNAHTFLYEDAKFYLSRKKIKFEMIRAYAERSA